MNPKQQNLLLIACTAGVSRVDCHSHEASDLR
jgi:hypothetical protein